MHKKTIAILFTILFTALITAPAIIIAIDDSVDISIFYSISEEEEESIKLPLPENSIKETEKSLANNSSKNLEYQFKKYPKPHLNLIFPPPELHIF